MGITISSKNNSCDIGYFGFRKFRILVANNAGKQIGEHYSGLEKAMLLFDEERAAFFEEYDGKTEKLIKDKILTSGLANFLYQSDCGGKIDKKQAKKIYELIKNEDDEISFGYAGRTDCATMKDMKLIFSENTLVKWG